MIFSEITKFQLENIRSLDALTTKCTQAKIFDGSQINNIVYKTDTRKHWKKKMFVHCSVDG